MLMFCKTGKKSVDCFSDFNFNPARDFVNSIHRIDRGIHPTLSVHFSRMAIRVRNEVWSNMLNSRPGSTKKRRKLGWRVSGSKVRKVSIFHYRLFR